MEEHHRASVHLKPVQRVRSAALCLALSGLIGQAEAER